MNIFRLVLIIIGILMLLLFAIPLFLPSSTIVERSIVIERPIEEVFDETVDFNTFINWNPWTKMESVLDFRVVSSEPLIGSKVEWNGDTIGKGYLERTKIETNKLIESDLIFIQPWETRAKDIMIFEPVTKGTKVRWQNHMALEYPFGRYMSLIMDAFLGTDFEKGLASLKVYCDTAVKTRMYPISIQQSKSKYYYFINDSSGFDSKDIERKLGKAFGELSEFFAKNQLAPEGAPLAITKNHNEKFWVFDAAMMAKDTSVPTKKSRISTAYMPEMQVLKCEFVGPYSNAYLAYKQIHRYMDIEGYKPAGNPWEEYISDPSKVAQDKLRTNIYYPIVRK